MKKEDYCLIVEDDFVMANLYKLILNSAGFENLKFCETISCSQQLIKDFSFSCIFLDIHLPDGNGLDYLSWHRENYPHIPVIIVTSESDETTEQACTELGAFDFFVKPFNKVRLLTSLRNALDHYNMRREIAGFTDVIMSQDVMTRNAFSRIITKSQHMLRIFKYIEALSLSSEPILIQGESGTGKELIAHAIHESSESSGKIVCINVSGLDDTMFSDSLFGHEKGSFTGADKERKGLIHEAAGGTLFLDEIGDLEVKSQIKLLRLLQEREYYTLGSDKPKQSHARIITATNVDLTSKINEGSFRKDLYYRLRPHRIVLPPLRERKDDILLLFNHFIKEKARELKTKIPVFPRELKEYLYSYSFPGNIREIKGIAEDLLFRSTLGPITEEELKYQFNLDLEEEGARDDLLRYDSIPDRIDFLHIMEIYGHIPTLEEVENMFIREALKYHNGNQQGAADMLGISQSKISRWLKKGNVTD
ncbi:MAG: sigma-54 dependent transcriptional regulator, partial [Spirochaetales bacterium]|nr:sigma-54 dependent transcriptional regulator [Spirochaetales bacterium]